MQEKNAALIVIWIGKFPNYFRLWLRSVRNNPGFDFLFYTDQELPERERPPNLFIHHVTLESIRSSIAQKLGLSLHFTHPYKLCDFKPAYGEIFEEHIQQYKFWGNCDIDLLFGKLDHFLTPDILNSYKKILIRGHLTLYKNESQINELYRHSATINYRPFFEDPSYCLFDEWHGINKIFKEFHIEQYHREMMVDINPDAIKFKALNVKNFSRQIFVWSPEGLFQYSFSAGGVKKTEFAYIHFQKRKMEIPDDAVFNSEQIIVNAKGFHPYNQLITLKTIRQYDVPNYGNYFRRQYRRIMKKIPTLDNTLVFNKKHIHSK